MDSYRVFLNDALFLSLSHLCAEMENREAQLREEVISKEAEISRIMEELRSCCRRGRGRSVRY